MDNETQKTTFFYQLKSYGLKKFLISFDFIIAIITLMVMLIDSYLSLDIFSGGNSNYVIAIFAVASTLFAIVLAALAIILSFSNSEFMSFLRQNNKLSSLLFLFWIGNVAYLVVIILSTVYLVVNLEKYVFIQKYLYPFIVAIFIYGVINTFYLLETVIRFGHFLDVYERLRQGKKN
ncbi:MAG: hypothetical protein Q8N87_03770 [bacterium]|nr:hypothetical protein [bacterium]